MPEKLEKKWITHFLGSSLEVPWKFLKCACQILTRNFQDFSLCKRTPFLQVSCKKFLIRTNLGKFLQEISGGSSRVDENIRKVDSCLKSGFLNQQNSELFSAVFLSNFFQSCFLRITQISER